MTVQFKFKTKFFFFPGGFAFVFVAEDGKTGKEYALKVNFNAFCYDFYLLNPPKKWRHLH